jgi:hypothetical protein
MNKFSNVVYDLLPTDITLGLFMLLAPLLFGTVDFISFSLIGSASVTARMAILLLFVLPSEYYFSRKNYASTAITLFLALFVALLPAFFTVTISLFLLVFKFYYKKS